jgi:hypothetical protein
VTGLPDQPIFVVGSRIPAMTSFVIKRAAQTAVHRPSAKERLLATTPLAVGR